MGHVSVGLVNEVGLVLVVLLSSNSFVPVCLVGISIGRLVLVLLG